MYNDGRLEDSFLGPIIDFYLVIKNFQGRPTLDLWGAVPLAEREPHNQHDVLVGYNSWN